MRLGIDIGFYATKLVGNGQRVHIPSRVAKYRESQVSLNGHDRIVLSYEDGDYMLGAEAIRLGGGARKETADWFQSRAYLMLLHGGIAKVTKATQASATIVTGLPVSDVAREKRALQARLIGTHIFTQKDRHRQRVTVDSVRVVPQGWGAVFCHLFDEHGNVANGELASRKVGVLDLGGHTVNYLSVEGLSDMPRESRSTEHGAWDVMRDVREFLDAEHPGLSRLADHQVMQAAIDREVYDGAELVDLTPIVAPILSDIGEEIVDTAGQYWGAGASTFRSILVCGGGAYLWGEHIKRAFPQATVLDAPEFANAQGYHNFAVYLGKKD